MQYMWYTRPADMRKSYNTLSGLVRDTGVDPCIWMEYVL